MWAPRLRLSPKDFLVCERYRGREARRVPGSYRWVLPEEIDLWPLMAALSLTHIGHYSQGL